LTRKHSSFLNITVSMNPFNSHFVLSFFWYEIIISSQSTDMAAVMFGIIAIGSINTELRELPVPEAR
jgi:hypothetical protein